MNREWLWGKLQTSYVRVLHNDIVHTDAAFVAARRQGQEIANNGHHKLVAQHEQPQGRVRRHRDPPRQQQWLFLTRFIQLVFKS